MKRLLPLLVTASFALHAGRGAAQFESQVLSKLQVNLVNPGGKSIALGGAFVAVADDATAALANPAGLTQLEKLQIGASGKRFEFRPDVGTGAFLYTPDGASLSQATTGAFEFSDRATELEFASVVLPVTPDLSVAVYQAVNLRYRLDTTGLPAGNFRPWSIKFGAAGTPKTYDEEGAVDVRSEVWGASVGLALGPISVGGGLTFSKLRFDLTGGAHGSGYRVRVNADTPGQAFDAQISTDVESGRKVGWLAGALVTLLEHPRLAVGAVYRRTPRFGVGYRIAVSSPGASYSCGGSERPTVAPSACGSFKVPDDFSVGFSLEPVSGFLLAAEVQRVKYSQLNEGFVPLFNYVEEPPGTRVTVPRGSSPDTTVPRVGAEYTLRLGGGTVLSLRAGWHREPGHATEVQLYADATGDKVPDTSDPVVLPAYSEALRTTFTRGDDESLLSFGFGATLGRALSIDLGAELGDQARSFVLSAFYRF